MSPQRIQRQRTKGWRMPDGCVYVGRPGRWGNRFQYGTPSALARMPAIDGSPWEYEGRISAAGRQHDMHLPDGRVITTHIRYLTVAECVDMYRLWLVTASPKANLWDRREHRILTVADVVADLAGKDLACWCPLEDADGNRVPCHADVLLEIANHPMGLGRPVAGRLAA